MWKKENLRKNFLRVKQIADQNLGRAEKSEVLTEEQQGSEKRVEVVRGVSHNLIKKITALLEAQPGTDAEKRLKKLPETGLSHALIESANQLGDDTLLGAVCAACGLCQGVLAQAELQCELDIERDVLTPLQQIADVDIPGIMKFRKQLNKSTLDMDSAKNRFNSAVRQSHAPGANMASAAAKADAVREEYEEAQSKVEMIKDNLSIELCNFIAKESEHSSRLVALLEAQAAYHKKALQAIEEALPKMKHDIDVYPLKPVFGMPLEEHLKVTDRDIALVLEACIVTLHETGMDEEGLFRIAGSALKVKKLRACLDAHIVDMEEFSTDPHTVAGVLKQYLRELPEPLLTFGLYHEFMQTTTLPQDQRLQAIQNAINKLPVANYNNVRYLVRFLAMLAQNSSKNKMTPSNIGIVMGPNLLWSKGETTPNMLTAGAVSAIIEAFVIHADRFFPGAADFDFHLTGKGRAPPSPYKTSPTSTIGSLVSNTASQAEALLPRSSSQPDVESAPQQPPQDLSQQQPFASSQEDVNTEPPSEQTESGEISVSSEDDTATYKVGIEPGEDMTASAEPGDSHMASRSGEGLVHTVVPPTNLSFAGSARQRPTMPASSSLPSVRGPVGSVDNLSYTGAVQTAPTTPTTPSKSVHSDMYSTMFALHSLGEGSSGTASQYLTRVRALWDGQFQACPTPRQQAPLSQGSQSKASSRAVADRGWSAAGSRTEKPRRGSGPGSHGSQEIDFSMSGLSSPSQDLASQQSATTTYAPPPVSNVSQSPVPDNTAPPTLQVSPVATTTSASTGANSPSPSQAESPEGPHSPKVQRRQTKKPAPPPPPERPYTVSVSAMSRSTEGIFSTQTWPRNAPLASPESPPQPHASNSDKTRHSPPERRTSGHAERPHGPPPERPERPSAPPPERPKLPPTVPQQPANQSGPTPGGHQRSASTGAMYINTGNAGATTTTSTTSGSASSHESLQAGQGSSLTAGGQGYGMLSGTSTLGRHSSMRPARPNPPPPPPPVAQKNEQTYL